MTTTVLDRAEIQGVVLSGYGHLPLSAYLLFRVDAPAPARAWLARVAADVTWATGKREGCSVNVALTWRGLKAFGLDAAALGSFPLPFVDGMDSPTRAAILGDTGADAPETWRWGNAANDVHVLLMVFAAGEAELAQQVETYTAAAAGLTLVAALPGHRLPDGREHFGFADGIGQPIIEGNERRVRKQKDRTGHVTVVKAGEFLLGYRNEYGLPALSPVVPAELNPGNVLPPYDVPDDLRFTSHTGPQHDLGRNGSYLVFRQLAQDVPAFWSFVENAARGPGGAPDHEAAVRLASKFVGRWPSGAPLVDSPVRDDPAYHSDNDFTYAAQDPYGFACPIGAHIRRANPRDAHGDDPRESLKAVRRHRLLRLGRSYGDYLEDPREGDGKERGLYFLCLNADIERQFEFVQQTWLNNTVLGGLSGENDPLVGAQDAHGCLQTMTVPADPLRQKVPNLVRFVRMIGGAYFFLPGRAALTYVTGLR